MIANTKLNTIKDIVSKALNDGNISEQEFRLILVELEKYNELKREVRKGAVKEIQKELSDVEKQKLIDEGKRIAKEELKKWKAINII